MSAEVTRRGVEDRRPGRVAITGGTDGNPGAAHDDEFASYYGQPIVRRPGWSEVDIVGYLFLGGLAGGSAVLALVEDRLGATRASRRAQLTAVGSAAASLTLLVHDLGRPARFLNMLRVVKPTSPMNMGSWLLAGFVPASILAAAGRHIIVLGPIARLAGPVAAVLGSAVVTYTAVLLSDTAVPAWHEAGDALPFVFVGSSAMAAGGLAMSMAPAGASGTAARFGVAGALVELVATERMHREAGPIRAAHERGTAGKLAQIGKLCAIGGVVAAVVGGQHPRLRRAGGLALVAASAVARLAVFRAGVASADDPRFVVTPQRRRVDQSPDREAGAERTRAS
jgi:formate-dependent nitrite reductase membrane component NrfD